MVDVRVANELDGGSCAEIYAPMVRDTAVSFEIEPPTAAHMASRIAAALTTHPWLVAEAAGEILGYAYSGKHAERAAYRWSVNVTVYVRAGARRSGVGKRLYGSLLAILSHQGFRSAFAGITLPNPGSVGLHEAMGFVPLGVYRDVGFKHGSWHDVGWWRLGLSQGDAPPSEPKDFEAFRNTSTLADCLG